MARKKTHNPTLIIGIGGTGKKTIQAIKRYIAENGGQRGLRQDYPYMEFLCFDSSTNLLDHEAVSRYDGVSDEDIKIHHEEVVQLRSSLKGFEIKDFPIISNWFDERMAPFLGSEFFHRDASKTGYWEDSCLRGTIIISLNLF